MVADGAAIFSAFTSFREGLTVSNLMGFPGKLFDGLQRALCMLLKAGPTLLLNVNTYIVAPAQWVLESLAIGTWAAQTRTCNQVKCLDSISLLTTDY